MATGAGGGVFPLPGVGVPSLPITRSRRCVARHRRVCRHIDLANGCIQGINDLSLYNIDYPSILYPSSLSQAGATSLQSRMLDHIHMCVSRYTRRRSDAASSVFDECLGGLFTSDFDVDYSLLVQLICWISCRATYAMFMITLLH